MKNLSILKWLTILIPTLVVWMFETFRHIIFVENDPMTVGNILMAGLVFVVIFFFVHFIFGIIEKMQRENIRRNQDMAVLEERERIAREMHDGFGQVLGYVNIKSQAARQLLASAQYAQAEDNLKELETVARNTYADIRDTILELRTTDPLKKGFTPVLKEYIARFNKICTIRTELEVNASLENYFSPDAELQIIRIIQESLTNIRKHARANHAWVRIFEQNGQTEVTIEDDGQGFDSTAVRKDNRPRFGLQIMKERAESIKGALGINSTLGKGTRVTLMLPSNQRMSL